MPEDYTKKGIEVIDQHHEKILGVIRLLAETIKTDNSKIKLSEIFQKLTFYAENYFIEEELLLQKYSYENLAKHKAEHKNFVLKLIELYYKFTHEDMSPWEELYQFLKNWYNKHISEYDNNAVEFLKTKIL